MITRFWRPLLALWWFSVITNILAVIINSLVWDVGHGDGTTILLIFLNSGCLAYLIFSRDNPYSRDNPRNRRGDDY